METQILVAGNINIVNGLRSNRFLLITLLVILIIFVLLTIAFVYVPVYKMRKQVDEINQRSIEAQVTLNKTAADAEDTLTAINHAVVRAENIEDIFFQLGAEICSRIPEFTDTPICIRLLEGG